MKVVPLKVHDFLTVGAAAPLQEAAVKGLELPDSYYQSLQKLYTQKRDFFLTGLDRIGLKHNEPQGTYFVLVDIQELLDQEMFSGMSDLEFCEWMIRFHFARQQETLEEALYRLEKLKNYKK